MHGTSLCLAEMRPNRPVPRTSARNCAQIYNSSFANDKLQHLLPTQWRRLKLDTELVWNSLFLYWLLEDCAENGLVLELDENASSQTLRISKGLKGRNDRFAGTGQPEWNHACDLCCWLSRDENGGELRCQCRSPGLLAYRFLVLGAVRSVVVDGVTVGRPCCGVQDCPKPLPSVKSRFCRDHEGLNNQCCVSTCAENIEPGFQTCSNPAHRKLEIWVHEQNKAMFQLKRRLARAGVPGDGDGSSSQIDDDFDDDYEIDIFEIQCDGKAEVGNAGPVKARFGRRRTHNEELVVYSCGVIGGRVTFYGSEAPNGVRVGFP